MNRDTRDYVKIASYFFITEHKKRFNQSPRGVLYNKFITLLHMDLKEHGTDICLPHCWYRWGDVVVGYCVPYIIWSHEDLDYTNVSYEGNAPRYNINDKTVISIKKFTEDFLSRYGPEKEDVENAIDEVYSKAPFKFQMDYKRLREILDISRKNISYSNYDEVMLSLLERTEKSYPSEFKTIRTQYDEFLSVFKESLKAKANREDLFDLAEDFWFFFCYHLRLNNKCHENVPPDTLNLWKSVLPEENNRYEASIQNYAYQLCAESNDSVVKKLLKAREIRLSELKNMLDKLE